MSALGQKADICIAKSDVRFTPESDIKCAYGMSAKGQADFVKRFLIKGDTFSPAFFWQVLVRRIFLQMQG